MLLAGKSTVNFKQVVKVKIKIVVDVPHDLGKILMVSPFLGEDSQFDMVFFDWLEIAT